MEEAKLVRQIRHAHTRARYLIKKFIAGQYDIIFIYSNIRIEANEPIYDIKSEKHDFEIQTSKLVRQIRNTHTRARYLIKKFIAGSYDIKFICSNTRIKTNGAIYDIKSEKCGFESWGVSHERKSKLVPQMRNATQKRVSK